MLRNSEKKGQSREEESMEEIECLMIRNFSNAVYYFQNVFVMNRKHEKHEMRRNGLGQSTE
jgi:hypothetical protein